MTSAQLPTAASTLRTLSDWLTPAHCGRGGHRGGSARRVGSTVAPSSLKGGQHVVFRAGELSIGRSVACTSSHGVRVVARVPDRGEVVVTIGDGMKGSATLSLTTRADSSVVTEVGSRVALHHRPGRATSLAHPCA
jgi:hypothetical protein